MSIVTVVGNPRLGSRTHGVAVRAAEAVARRIGDGEALAPRHSGKGLPRDAGRDRDPHGF